MQIWTTHDCIVQLVGRATAHTSRNSCAVRRQAWRAAYFAAASPPGGRRYTALSIRALGLGCYAAHATECADRTTRPARLY